MMAHDGQFMILWHLCQMSQKKAHHNTLDLVFNISELDQISHRYVQSLLFQECFFKIRSNYYHHF